MINTICFTHEIPEKEVIPNKKPLEKEKQKEQQTYYEEKPLTVTAS